MSRPATPSDEREPSDEPTTIHWVARVNEPPYKNGGPYVALSLDDESHEIDALTAESLCHDWLPDGASIMTVARQGLPEDEDIDVDAHEVGDLIGEVSIHHDCSAVVTNLIDDTVTVVEHRGDVDA